MTQILLLQNAWKFAACIRFNNHSYLGIFNRCSNIQTLDFSLQFSKPDNMISLHITEIIFAVKAICFSSQLLLVARSLIGSTPTPEGHPMCHMSWQQSKSRT